MLTAYFFLSKKYIFSSLDWLNFDFLYIVYHFHKHGNKFIYNGLLKQNRNGCNGKCGKLHPNACRDSLKTRECGREKCCFYHPVPGTKNPSTKNTFQNQAQNLNQNQIPSNQTQNQFNSQNQSGSQTTMSSCICPQNVSLRKERRVQTKFGAPPKEMLVSFSIVLFLTNYDVTNRKQ